MARRELPPLRALSAFEAAARRGSFRLAADELGITRSAISHQVKALEDVLGVELFRRDGRKAELSAAGQVYFPAVRDAFDQIESQTQVIRPSRSDQELTIQVYVTVALKWLIPRLHDFERRHPDMRVRLSTSYFDWDFDERNADVALILARKESPGHHYRKLFRSVLTPVCAPRLLEGPRPLRVPADLAGHKLFYVYTAEEDWKLWLDAAGVTARIVPDRIAFDSYILAQEAALEGHGVAMTIGPFARDDIAAGRLVEPFAIRAPHRHWWQFACQATHRMKPAVRRFEAWLVEQVAADPELAALAPEAAAAPRRAVAP